MNTAIGRYKYPVALAFSLLCAIAAIWLARNYLEIKEREIRQEIMSSQKLAEVVVAKKDLPVGSEISAKTMSLRKIPEEYIPDDAIHPDRFSEVDGMSINSPMRSGHPLMRHNIRDVARIEKFSDLLSPGERALTLEVDGTTSAEYMLEAGDVIDLAIKGRDGNSFEPVLEQIRVLATGRVTTADTKTSNGYKKGEYQTLTIGVDSSKVASVLLADSRKELVFLLRNERDKAGSRYQANSGRTVEVIVGGEGEGGLTVKTEVATNLTKSGGTKRNNDGRMLAKAARSLDAGINKEQKDEVLAHGK